MLKVLDNDRADNDATADEDTGPTLGELARTGARQMLMTALAVEVAQYVDAHQEARDEHGRRRKADHSLLGQEPKEAST